MGLYNLRKGLRISQKRASGANKRNPIEYSTPMVLYIKYMVSLRCKIIVKDELAKLGLEDAMVELGVVETTAEVEEAVRDQLKVALSRFGLELMDDRKTILIERIKIVIIEMIHYSNGMPKVNYSAYIAEKLNYDYTYLANIFSEVQGITIQQYIIIHRIEKAKEYLLYGELNLSEIAFRLHYSSAAHLSNQFKKVTGHSPRVYKKLKPLRASNLEDV